jgi:hypothetical protein
VERADSSLPRVAVFVTFHWSADRLRYIGRTLAALRQAPDAVTDIFIYINDVGDEVITQIRRSLAEAGVEGSCEIRCCRDLLHPFLLTWAHKDEMRRMVETGEGGYTHFLYVEDDEEITATQLAYLLDYGALLKPLGLLPGVYRTEMLERTGQLIATDQPRRTVLAGLPFVKAGGLVFTEIEMPYCGLFFLDRDQAREYVASHSFDVFESTLVSRWGSRERATQGLTFENPPCPFGCRVVFPLDPATLQPVEQACVRHLPDNYVNDPDRPAESTVPIDDLTVGRLSPPGRIAGVLRHAKNRIAGRYRIVRKMLKVMLFPARKDLKI